jgi:hypothetical protein
LFGGGSANFVLLAIAVVVWMLSSAESRAAEREPEQPVRARAYPTDAFRRPVDESAGGHTADPLTRGERPEPGNGFVVSVVQSPDGRTLRVLRIRRD